MAAAVLAARRSSCFETWAVFRARARTPDGSGRWSASARSGCRTCRFAARGHALRVEDPGFFASSRRRFLHARRGHDDDHPGAGRSALYFDGFRPGFAKLEQSLIARFVLDPAMSKARPARGLHQLCRASAPGRGRDIIGFAAAAEHYYRRPFAALTDREYLSLVAMLMAPDALDPVRHPAGECRAGPADRSPARRSLRAARSCATSAMRIAPAASAAVRPRA